MLLKTALMYIPTNWKGLLLKALLTSLLSPRFLSKVRKYIICKQMLIESKDISFN